MIKEKFLLEKNALILLGDKGLADLVIKELGKHYQNPKKLMHTEALSGVRDQIFNHPYLRFDDVSLQFDLIIKQRRMECDRRLEILRKQVSEGVIEQCPKDFISNTRIDPNDELSPNRVKLLDLDDDFMLIEIARHPVGGQKPLHQFLLHSSGQHKLFLLNYQYREGLPKFATVGENDYKSKFQTNNHLKVDFENRILSLLGANALKRINRYIKSNLNKTALVEFIYEGKTCDLDIECLSITGYSIVEKEQSKQTSKDSIWHFDSNIVLEDYKLILREEKK